MLQCADTTDILKRKRKFSRSIFFYVYFVIINAITCHLAIMEPTSRIPPDPFIYMYLLGDTRYIRCY